MNTVTVSFNTTVRQMTEMSQWPKCLSNKWTKCLSEKHRSASNSRDASRWFGHSHVFSMCLSKNIHSLQDTYQFPNKTSFAFRAIHDKKMSVI